MCNGPKIVDQGRLMMAQLAAIEEHYTSLITNYDDDRRIYGRLSGEPLGWDVTAKHARSEMEAVISIIAAYECWIEDLQSLHQKAVSAGVTVLSNRISYEIRQRQVDLEGYRVVLISTINTNFRSDYLDRLPSIAIGAGGRGVAIMPNRQLPLRAIASAKQNIPRPSVPTTLPTDEKPLYLFGRVIVTNNVPDDIFLISARVRFTNMNGELLLHPYSWSEPKRETINEAIGRLYRLASNVVALEESLAAHKHLFIKGHRSAEIILFQELVPVPSDNGILSLKFQNPKTNE